MSTFNELNIVQIMCYRSTEGIHCGIVMDMINGEVVRK